MGGEEATLAPGGTKSGGADVTKCDQKLDYDSAFYPLIGIVTGVA